jgi:hypothetical protein
MIIKSLPRAPQISKRDGILDKMEKVSQAPPVLKIKTRVEETPPHLTPEFLGEEAKEKPQEQIREIKPVILAKAEPQFREISVVKKPEPVSPALAPKVIEMTAIPAQKPGAAEVKPSISVMDRLRPLISDPSVQSINCPGPEKNLVLMRFGMPQATNIVLTADEIKSFLKEISEKTKIPLLPGIFKVIYQNLIITAIVSEFVGTKFVIEKKPLAPLPFPGQLAPPARVQFR